MLRACSPAAAGTARGQAPLTVHDVGRWARRSGRFPGKTGEPFLLGGRSGKAHLLRGRLLPESTDPKHPHVHTQAGRSGPAMWTPEPQRTTPARPGPSGRWASFRGDHLCQTPRHRTPSARHQLSSSSLKEGSETLSMSSHLLCVVPACSCSSGPDMGTGHSWAKSLHRGLSDGMTVGFGQQEHRGWVGAVVLGNQAEPQASPGWVLPTRPSCPRRSPSVLGADAGGGTGDTSLLPPTSASPPQPVWVH